VWVALQDEAAPQHAFLDGARLHSHPLTREISYRDDEFQAQQVRVLEGPLA
jgi:hypothetical protein